MTTPKTTGLIAYHTLTDDYAVVPRGLSGPTREAIAAIVEAVARDGLQSLGHAKELVQ